MHSDHKPLEYLHAQTKLQQARHMKWMSYLMTFDILIRYKKGVTNKLADMLSRPPISLLVAMRIQPLVPSEYEPKYQSSKDFKKVYETAVSGKPGDFAIRDGLLYKGKLLCIPEDGDRLTWLREAHTSRVAGHFGVTKTLLNLQRYVFWPKMQVDVSRYVRGCKLCCISKPSNRKRGLYLPLPDRKSVV